MPRPNISSTASAFGDVHRLLKQKDFGRALSALIDQRTGRIKHPYRSDRNHAWYLIGDIRFRCGEYEDAAKSFRKALKAWPQDYQALWALANCCSELGKPSFAKRYLRKAIKMKGPTDELLYNLGNPHFDLGEHKEAVQCYSSVASKRGQLARLAKRNIALTTRVEDSNG